jgi:sulfite reductase (ferredoxin)
MTDASENGAPEKLSPVEIAKAKSNYLRGEIPEELVDGNDFVGKDSIQLLKNHGTYQQDDRERRAEARTDGAAGKAKFYRFMVRTAIPGGRQTSDQLLAEIDLCDEVGNTTLRITTRQGLQLHGIL